MKRGQIWVETVIYTLIGLSLIGIALAFIMPRVNDVKDKSVVEQTINSLTNIDSLVNEVLKAPGNVRVIDQFLIKRGEFYIDTTNDQLYYIIGDLRKLYSQNGTEISFGRIKLVSTQTGNKNSVKINVGYTGIDIQYKGSDNQNPEKFSAASTPYKLKIENKGVVDPIGGKLVINFEEIS